MPAGESVEIRPGVRLGVVEYGAPDGEPVLYFHGWPGSRFEAAVADEPARAASVRLIAIDRPGIGRSTPAPGRRISDWPGQVDQLASALHLTHYSVLGVSGGGPYALACAAQPAARLRNVGVCCGAAPLSDRTAEACMPGKFRVLMWFDDHASHIMEWGLALGAVAYRLGLSEAIVRAFVFSLPPQERETLRVGDRIRLITASITEALRHGVAGFIEDGRLLRAAWGIDLTGIRRPVTFWHGTLDAVIPFAMAQRLVERVPQAELIVYPGASHFSLPMDHAEELLRSLLGR